ncbi:hypothetical protein GKODMF_02445 [Candidatus Electrothrix gigas]
MPVAYLFIVGSNLCVRPCIPGKIFFVPFLRSFHYMDAFAVWTDPGGTIADTPSVFFKTVRADGKTTTTAPAKRELFFAAMTGSILFSSSTSCQAVPCHIFTRSGIMPYTTVAAEAEAAFPAEKKASFFCFSRLPLFLQPLVRLHDRAYGT